MCEPDSIDLGLIGALSEGLADERELKRLAEELEPDEEDEDEQEKDEEDDANP